MFRRASAPPAFTLDLIARRRAPSLLGWLVLLAGVSAAVAALLEYDAVQQRLEAAQNRLAHAERLQQRAAGLAARRKRTPVPEAELRRAARLAANLQGPWLQLMPRLEAAADKDIALLALDADTGRGQLNLAGEARSLEAVFDYARRIDAQPGFASVQVQNYEFHKLGTQDVVQFKLSARWRSDT